MTTTQYINLSLQIWGCFLTVIIIVCLCISKRTVSKADRVYMELLLFNAGVMLFDALALYFRGGESTMAYFGVRLSNLLAFCCGAVVPTVFLHYLICCFTEPRQIPNSLLHISRITCAGWLVLYLVNLFIPFFYRIDAQNLYHREFLYPLRFLPFFLNVGFSLYLLFRYRKQMEKAIQITCLIYLVIPFPVFLVQMFVYGLNLVNFAGMTVTVIIFLFIQSQQANRILQQELELSERKNALMFSQIQPHFLYNTLTSIYQLCDTKPEAAKEAISHFSKYLRGNLDSLNQPKMISFAEELKHLQAYLSLEKMRYDDYLQIVYHIHAADFLIPALTVQPLVENAIKHGISDLPNGGCVTISTLETETEYEIHITDNGVGFTPGTLPADGRTHIGITAVKRRLQIMCSGILEINSAPGQGTTAIVKIPK